LPPSTILFLTLGFPSGAEAGLRISENVKKLSVWQKMADVCAAKGFIDTCFSGRLCPIIPRGLFPFFQGSVTP